MKKISHLIFSLSIVSISIASAQTKKPVAAQAKAFPAEVARPKLVVGLVVGITYTVIITAIPTVVLKD